MKKYFQKIAKLLMVFITLFAGYTVNAETAPASLNMTHYALSKTPIEYPRTFNIKKTTSGKYAYCTYYTKDAPIPNVTYTRGSQITDNGMNYILNDSMKAKNDNDFFIYQNALWIYMADRGLMPGTYYDITAFSSRINNNNNAVANQIKAIVNRAKNASTINTNAPTIQIDTSAAKFTHSDADDMYIFSPITINSSTGKYTVTLNDAPKGAITQINGNQLRIVIPNKSLTNLSTKISFSVSNSKTVYTSYNYSPNNNKYQTMAVTYPETKTATATKNVTLVRNKSIEIDKIDENNKSISGAVLEVSDSKGNIIDTWTTDGQKHKIEKLSQGTYTVTEKSAPKGYVLNTQKTTFTVKEDGTVVDSNNNTINVIQIKNVKTSVKISKQDITNKQELPGATLVIKNENKEEVIKWISTNKPHIIKGLAAGTYTLTEQIAPLGYVLSTETITFKLDNYGKLYDQNGNSISSITMYNKKSEKKICKIENGKYYGSNGEIVTEQEYKNQCEKKQQTIISKQDIATGKLLPGATLVVKDYNGSVIDTWISTNEAHIIEGLKPGIYTLSEISAPAGYILSTETVTFTVKEDGSITKVVMYNTKDTKTETPRQTTQEVVVDNTASFKTVISTIFGLVITSIGAVILVITSKSKKQNKI